MTNCNKPTFPLLCDNADFSEPFHNTGEQIYYQKIDLLDVSKVDGVVLLERNGNYYKAIYTENTINIEWYRCRYKNDQNDEVMITQAIKTAAYLGATLRFDAREYVVNRQLEFQKLSCFKLLGDKQHTIIKSNSTQRFHSYYFYFKECNNIIIEGIRIDQNKKNLVVYQEQDWGGENYPEILRDFNGGIYVEESTNIEIKDCSFLDLYTRAVHIYACFGDIKITNNLFESSVQTQMYRLEHLTLSQSRDANIIVENNFFKNAENHNPATGVVAIFAFDLGETKSVLINNNFFEYCGRDHTGIHRLYAIDFYDNVNNFIVSNNTFKNLTWGAIRFDGTRKNGIICDNIFHQLIPDQDGMIMASSREAEKYNQTEFKNISIHNNILDSETELSHGISIQGLSPFCAAENIQISNNKMYNLRYGIRVHGDVSVVSINNNQAFNLIGIGIKVEGFKTGFNNVSLLPKKIEKIYINNNHLNGRKELEFDGYVGIQVDGLDGAHTYMGRVLINDNFITGNAKARGVVVNTGNSAVDIGNSLDNKVTILGNTIESAEHALHLRRHKTFVKDNVFYDCTTPFLEDFSDNIKVGNFHNNLPV